MGPNVPETQQGQTLYSSRSNGPHTSCQSFLELEQMHPPSFFIDSDRNPTLYGSLTNPFSGNDWR